MGQSTILHYARLFLESPGQQTAKDEDVPLVFREPGVKSGYRQPYRCWAYYLSSMFRLNNETLNIWSHLIGCLLMCYQFYTYTEMYDFWTDGATRPLLLYTACCVVYTFLSTVAHSIHSKSDHMHYTCFQADYGGNGLYVYGTGLLAFYLSCYEKSLYTTFLPYFLPINTFMAWVSCLCCSFAKLKYKRPYPFTRKLWQLCSVGVHVLFIYSVGIFPRYANCLMDNACNLSSLWHHTLCFLVFCPSIFFFASHLPENLWPGKFDIVGQGHQIFHVLIVITSCFQLVAAHKDLTQHALLKWHREYPSAWHLIVSFGVVVLSDMITILVLRKYVRRRIEKDKRP